MSRNWNRAYRFVAGAAGTGFEIGATPAAGRALHIKFDLEKTDVSSNNTGTISIWNLNDEHVSVLEQQDCMIEIHAGYGNTLPLIFCGNVTNPETELEGADRKTTIDVVDGRIPIRDSVVALSYQGVIPVATILNDCIAQMGITCIYSQGAMKVLAEMKMPNGYSYGGAAANCLTQICDMCGFKWSIQNGVAQVHMPGEPISVQAYILSESTGLIRIPKRIAFAAESTSQEAATTATQYGYEVEYFLNGAINVNDMVQLQSKAASGFFRVKNIKITGDNLESDWTCTAQLLEVTATA